MPAESVNVWNLTQYLIARWELTPGTFPYAALLVGAVLLCGIVPYLLGSINPAILISKGIYKTDVRTLGSGNAGTTNMLRAFGKKAAAATLILDLSKAAVAYWFGFFLFLGMTGGAIAGFFVVLGHIFPIFAKFRGGKGVACLAVVALCQSPLTFAIVLAIWLIVVLGTRYVSLGSVMAALLYPLILRAFVGVAGGASVAFAIAAVVFVIFRHRENLKRLWEGKENKLQFSKKKKKEKNDDGNPTD